MRQLLVVVSIAGGLALPACNCGKPNALADTNGVLSLDSNELDFGPVTEFTQKTLPIHLNNTGKGDLTLMSATLDSTSSADFKLGDAPMAIRAGESADLQVTFSPLGPGDDTGSVTLATDDPDHPSVSVSLHGGPIGPLLEFDPDGGELSFVPTSALFSMKMAAIRSAGGSTLHVSGVGVNAMGNPDFSIVPPALPASLKPGEAVAVEVDYAKSMRTTNGIMEVNSDGADGGLSRLLLIPDPAHQCQDGIDNDMDGLIDFPDDPGCTSPEDDDEYNAPECVDGALRPCGTTVGTCKMGTQVCAHSIWGGCDGGVAPQPEQCNGLDDNCNGVTDEGISQVCTIFGCAGAQACIIDAGVADGGWTACIPVTAMPEVCNGKDDNCNGMIDEGIVQTCTINGCGGVQICIPGGDGGFTSCMPSAPHAEVCNGIDDDCNGQIDDGIPPQTCGLGACLRSAPGCMNGAIPTCMQGTPGTEICNGIDDDCDGTIDNVMPSTLTCGMGACFRSVPACIGTAPNMCVPGPMTAEICNNMDDNCNGTIDEGVTQSCYTGDAGTNGVGPCHGGTATCTMGAFGSCVGQVLPTTETCNGIDDNCNGPIDDGITPVSCYTGAAGTNGVGPCHGGTQNCVGGTFSGPCNGQVVPITEICGNNIDDNCDGTKDEGCAVDAGCTPTTWYQNHSYNPATGLPTPVCSNQFFTFEPVATKLTLPATAFPLTITHVRFRGRNSGQTVIVEIRADNAGTPGAVLFSTTVTSNGTYQIAPWVSMPQPTFPTQTTFWVGMEGAGGGLMNVCGDGSEGSPNYCFDSTFSAWSDFSTMGPPFTGLGDILFAVGQCP